MKRLALSIAALAALVTAGSAAGALSNFHCESTSPLEEKKSCEWTHHYHGTLQQVAPTLQNMEPTLPGNEANLRIGHPFDEVGQVPVFANAPAFAILARHELVSADRVTRYDVVVGIAEVKNRWVVSAIVFRKDGSIVESPVELPFEYLGDAGDEPRAIIEFEIGMTEEPLATRLAIGLHRSTDGARVTHSFLLEPAVRLHSRTLGPILDAMMPPDSEVNVRYFEF